MILRGLLRCFVSLVYFVTTSMMADRNSLVVCAISFAWINDLPSDYENNCNLKPSSRSDLIRGYYLVEIKMFNTAETINWKRSKSGWQEVIWRRKRYVRLEDTGGVGYKRHINPNVTKTSQARQMKHLSKVKALLDLLLLAVVRSQICPCPSGTPFCLLISSPKKWFS